MFGGGAGFGSWVVILAHWIVVNVGEEKEFDRGDRKKKRILKNRLHMNNNCVYMHDYCPFTQPRCIFTHFYTH